MADIFLSYARRERHRAEPIRDALESLGLEVFFDVDGLDGGDVFPDVLDRELKSAGAVVSLWSPWSLTRPWIKIESRIGKDRGVLIPVDIADIDPLHDLPAAFYDDQRIDLTDFGGNTAHPGWIKLVKSLARTLRRPELLEREARTNVHSSAQADDLRREVEALRAQIGDIAAAKAVASSQDRGRKEAFALIDKSISRSDHRLFLDRFKDGAEAFEAERRLNQLDLWAKVDGADPNAIAQFLNARSDRIYPALADEARRVQKQALKASGAGRETRWALAGLGVLVFGGAIVAWLDPLGWRGDNTGGTKAEEQVVSVPAGAAEIEAGVTAEAKALVAAPAAATAASETAPAETLASHRTYLADPANAVYRAEAEAAIARHEAAVLRLQTALAARGFASGSVDGRAGSTTARAIEAFRAASGYASSGVDLTAIDAAPIIALAGAVETWTRPATAARPVTEPATTPSVSSRKPGDVFSDCTECPSVVVVPAGSFTMGSPSTETDRRDDEGPQRKVTIGSSFAVGRYEVTSTQYSACVSDGAC